MAGIIEDKTVIPADFRRGSVHSQSQLSFGQGKIDFPRSFQSHVQVLTILAHPAGELSQNPFDFILFLTLEAGNFIAGLH